MTDTPPDWVLIEAAKRFGWNGEDELTLRHAYLDEINDQGFTALCDMIQKYEQPPVDRKRLCVEEAYKEMEALLWDEKDFDLAVRAIELFEKGFGRD